MGASESRPSLSENQDAPRQGYHVVRVAQNSPAHQANLEPFFDFCIGIDGIALEPIRATDGSAANSTSPAQEKSQAQAQAQAQSQSLAMGAWKRLEEKEGTTVTLNVWNSRTQSVRDVPIIPNRSWSSSSASSSEDPSSQPSLLGLSLRLCDPSKSLQHVWHILDILDGSPASSAGLVPFGDYVIGWAGGPLGQGGEGDFYELIESHQDRPLRLFIYNSDLDITREAVLLPNRQWGGEGLLGCGVGYGLLHRIPKPQDRAPQSSDLDLENEPSTPQMNANGFSEDTDATPVQRSNQPPRDKSRDQSLPEQQEEEEEEEEDEDEEVNRSGVTVSVREEEEE